MRIHYPQRISRQEYRCLILTISGKTAKEIGQVLSISYKTVENHLANLKGKLGCRKKAELFRSALENGFAPSQLQMPLNNIQSENQHATSPF